MMKGRMAGVLGDLALPVVPDGTGGGIKAGRDTVPGSALSVGESRIYSPLGMSKSGEFQKNGTMRRF
jgi:hypothetical protein